MSRKAKNSFTLDDLKRSAVANINQNLFASPVEKKPVKSKYGNSKTEVDGIVFDSAKEAGRYKELLLLRKAGLIGIIQLQVPYELNDGGRHSLRYIADFVYVDAVTGKTVVEDVKGFRTREYLKKKRLMLKVHNIEITEK